MKTIYFVRHGESETNVGPVNQGAEAQLTEKGRQQARSIALRCAALPIETIIASPFVRTKETAEIIAEKVGKPIEFSGLFIERRRASEQYGMLKDSDEYRRINTLIFDSLPIPGFRYSDEENFDDMNTRAAAALALLAARPEEHILVVGHGMFTMVLAGRALMGNSYNGRECLCFLRGLRTTNTGFTIMRHDAINSLLGVRTPWMISTWNDHAHLG